MINISFLISTNRDYQQCAKRVVDNIEQMGLLDNNEIIICSNDTIIDNRIINIEDKLKLNGPLGFNQAASISKGEIILILCDDHYLNILTDVNQLFSDNIFLNRSYHIMTMATTQDFLNPAYIGAIPGYPETSIIPRTMMCRFPILTRETYYKLQKYIFHPAFNLKTSYFPDNYLSYFLFINNEPVVQTDKVLLTSFQSEISPSSETYFYKSLSIYIKLIKNLRPGDPYVS